MEILYDYEIFFPFFRFEFPIYHKICNDSECFYFPIEFLKSSSRSNRRNFEYLEFCFLCFKINPSSKFSTIRLETFFYFSPPSLESIARRNFQVWRKPFFFSLSKSNHRNFKRWLNSFHLPSNSSHLLSNQILEISNILFNFCVEFFIFFQSNQIIEYLDAFNFYIEFLIFFRINPFLEILIFFEIKLSKFRIFFSIFVSNSLSSFKSNPRNFKYFFQFLYQILHLL